MDEELINKAISIAIQTAINIYEEKREELIKEQKNQNIQRIKNILKKYRIMKEYLKLNQDTLNNLENESTKDDTGLSNRIPEVMKRFDRAFIILKYVYEKIGLPEDIRCYQIIEDLYLSEASVGKEKYLQGEDKISMIAAKYNINKRTVYKDIDKASNMLSLLYFGILD